MSRIAIALATACCLIALGGCGSDSSTSEAKDSPTGATTGTADPTGAPGGPGAWPAFAPSDYTYRLEVLCYCPQVGAVRVRVTDGKVATAKVLTGPNKGKDAPDFARLTINDIIDRANSPQVATADVTWPSGQDHPSVVKLDQIANAVDDEVTYTIANVNAS